MGLWRPVGSEELKEWRKDRRHTLSTQRGARWETNTARTKGLDPAHQNDDGTASVSTTTATGIRSGRETAEIAAQEMIAWAQEDRATFMHRVRQLKAMGNFAHLTDEDAANRLWEICHRVAQEDAKRVYARDGYDRLTWKADIGDSR